MLETIFEEYGGTIVATVMIIDFLFLLSFVYQLVSFIY